MRRVFAMLMLVCLLVTSLMFLVLPVSASPSDQQCWQSAAIYRNDTGSPGTANLSLHDFSPQTASYSDSFTLAPGETRTVSIFGLFPLSANNFSSTTSSLTLTFLGFGNFSRVDYNLCVSQPGKINDGRINAFDLAAPLAAYCANGGIAVWDIDDQGQGTLAFTATAEQISAGLSTAASSGQNQLVAEGLGDSLYALMSNQIALFGPDVKESGKTYQFLAPGTSASRISRCCA